MLSNKVVPLNDNGDAFNTTATATTTSATTKNNTTTTSSTTSIIRNEKVLNIDIIAKQSALALEVEIIITNGEEGNTIYKLRGSTIDWLMLVDCDFGSLVSKFVGLLKW